MYEGTCGKRQNLCSLQLLPSCRTMGGTDLQLQPYSPLEDWIAGVFSYRHGLDNTGIVEVSSARSKWRRGGHLYSMTSLCSTGVHIYSCFSTETHTAVLEVYFHRSGPPSCKVVFNIFHCHRTDNTRACCARGNGCLS